MSPVDYGQLLRLALPAIILVATALQDVASGFVAHALQKAVLFRAASLFRLKSSFWHIALL